jgi:glycosyltransferase involved in cell wall biosynthesis
MVRGSQQAGKLGSLPLALVGLAQWARRLRRQPSVTDAHVIYSLGFKTHLATAIGGVRPVVWHLHEFPPATTGRLWRFLARTVPDQAIANSQAAGEAWRARERGTVPLLVIPNGVNLDRFKPRPRTGWVHDALGIPKQCRIIGMPAVFAKWKGQLAVLEAFRTIAPGFPDVHLVFVGGSIYDTVAEREYGEQLAAMIGNRESGIGNRGADAPRLPAVHILPFQREIELAYPEFEIALHYSLRAEPFGRVVLEAMACGVPVIAAGEGGPVEILGIGEPGVGNRGTRPPEPVDSRFPVPDSPSSGWLVPPRDPPALAEALRQALSLPSAALHSMGDAGRRRAEEHFSARRFARDVADVLRSVSRARDAG